MRATIVYEGKKLSGGQEKKETTRLGEVGEKGADFAHLEHWQRPPTPP